MHVSCITVCLFAFLPKLNILKFVSEQQAMLLSQHPWLRVETDLLIWFLLHSTQFALDILNKFCYKRDVISHIPHLSSAKRSKFVLLQSQHIMESSVLRTEHYFTSNCTRKYACSLPVVYTLTVDWQLDVQMASPEPLLYWNFFFN